MLDVKTIEVFYQYFYAKKYKEKYVFKRTKTTNSVCESFLKILDKEYSLHCVRETFLWEYFLFQFNYWHDLTINSYHDKLAIAYIVGKKAFDRWKTRDREYDWQIDTYKVVELYGVHKKDLFTKREPVPNKGDNWDDSIRKKFHNTERGFATCVELTTLYDPKDVSCINCVFQEDCKEMLRVNYPALFKNRLTL